MPNEADINRTKQQTSKRFLILYIAPNLERESKT